MCPGSLTRRKLAPMPEWDIFETFRHILATLCAIDSKLEKLMTTDASVAAVAADIETQVQALTAATAASTTAINAVLAEVQNGDATVSAQTLAALQQAQADLDSANTANTTAVAQETAESQPPVPPASA